jgi:hypothetical protein
MSRIGGDDSGDQVIAHPGDRNLVVGQDASQVLDADAAPVEELGQRKTWS